MRHPSGVDRFLLDFQKTQSVLELFPYAGSDRPDLGLNVRMYTMRPHLIFHRVEESNRIVRVTRVVHGSRDLNVDEFDDG